MNTLIDKFVNDKPIPKVQINAAQSWYKHIVGKHAVDMDDKEIVEIWYKLHITK